MLASQLQTIFGKPLNPPTVPPHLRICIFFGEIGLGEGGYRQNNRAVCGQGSCIHSEFARRKGRDTETVSPTGQHALKTLFWKQREQCCLCQAGSFKEPPIHFQTVLWNKCSIVWWTAYSWTADHPQEWTDCSQEWPTDSNIQAARHWPLQRAILRQRTPHPQRQLPQHLLLHTCSQHPGMLAWNISHPTVESGKA